MLATLRPTLQLPTKVVFTAYPATSSAGDSELTVCLSGDPATDLRGEPNGVAPDAVQFADVVMIQSDELFNADRFKSSNGKRHPVPTHHRRFCTDPVSKRGRAGLIVSVVGLSLAYGEIVQP